MSPNRDQKKRQANRKGVLNGRVKLNFLVATKIRNTHKLGGISTKDLSILFKISVDQIRRVLKNSIWI